MSKEAINLELSRHQLEMELKRVQTRKRRTKIFQRTVMWMLIGIILMVTVSALWFPVIWMAEGTPAGPAGERGVLTVKKEVYRAEELVVWNRSGEAAIMRVIATAGERIDYDDQGRILINEKPLKITANLAHISSVPDDCVLLIEQSGDEMHCVRSDEIIGKVLVQVWPLPFIGTE